MAVSPGWNQTQKKNYIHLKTKHTDLFNHNFKQNGLMQSKSFFPMSFGPNGGG